MWWVRELYNIVSVERLDEIEGWLRETKNEDGYEVRSFCEPSAISHLAPLVIGDQHAFLSAEDDRFFRVQPGIHLENHEATALVLRYCETLWNDQRVFKLRTGYGLDENALRQLRERVISIAENV